MEPNPVLKRLGFANDDRVVIIHTDDIGMCHASVEAFAQLWEFGLISSGAVMVPCPWFLKAAEYARARPEADLGVHITLTCEYPTYRWGPVSTRDPQSGIIDEQGFFYRTNQPVQERGDPAFVQREMEAQVERALAAGIQPTHIDTHMGTVAVPKFIPAYLQTALKFGLPAMMLRTDAAGWMTAGLDAQTAAFAVMFRRQIEEMGLPLLDHLASLHLERSDNRLDYAKQALAETKPGLTHFIIHPSVDTPELRAITGDWRSRTADYQTFMSEELRETVRKLGIQVIGYRQLKELMPAPEVLAGIR